jgi:hypothetical protein
MRNMPSASASASFSTRRDRTRHRTVYLLTLAKPLILQGIVGHVARVLRGGRGGERAWIGAPRWSAGRDRRAPQTRQGGLERLAGRVVAEAIEKAILGRVNRPAVASRSRPSLDVKVHGQVCPSTSEASRPRPCVMYTCLPAPTVSTSIASTSRRMSTGAFSFRSHCASGPGPRPRRPWRAPRPRPRPGGLEHRRYCGRHPLYRPLTSHLPKSLL